MVFATPSFSSSSLLPSSSSALLDELVNWEAEEKIDCVWGGLSIENTQQIETEHPIQQQHTFCQ